MICLSIVLQYVYSVSGCLTEAIQVSLGLIKIVFKRFHLIYKLTFIEQEKWIKKVVRNDTMWKQLA